MKVLTVGDLRKLLEGLKDNQEVRVLEHNDGDIEEGSEFDYGVVEVEEELGFIMLKVE
jgi:hypothetical protein